MTSSNTSHEMNEEQLKARFKLKEVRVMVMKLTLADINRMCCVNTNVLTKVISKPAELDSNTCTAGTSISHSIASKSKNVCTPLKEVTVSPYVFMYNIRNEIGCLKTVRVKQDPIDSDRRLLSCCDCEATSNCRKRKQDLHYELSDSDASTIKVCVRPTKRVKRRVKIISDADSENKKPQLVSASFAKFDERGGGDRLVICKEEHRSKLVTSSLVKSSIKKRKKDKSSDHKKNEVARILNLIKSKLVKRNSADHGEDVRTVVFRDSSNFEKLNSIEESSQLSDSCEGEKASGVEEAQLPESDLRNIILRNQSKQCQENELGNVKSRLGRQLSNEEFESALQNQNGSQTLPHARSFIIPKKIKEEPIVESPLAVHVPIIIEPEILPEAVVIEAPIECEDEAECDEAGWPSYCPVITNSHLKPTKDPKKALPSFRLLEEEMADLRDPGWSNFKETFLNRQLYSPDWNDQCTPITNHNLSVQNYKLNGAIPKLAPWYDAQKRFYETIVPNIDTSLILTVREMFEHRKRLASQYYDKKLEREMDRCKKVDKAFRLKYKKIGLETVKYAKMKESEKSSIRNSSEQKMNELKWMNNYIVERFELGAEEVRDIRQRFHVGQLDNRCDAILEHWEVDELKETDAFLLKLSKAFHKP